MILITSEGNEQVAVDSLRTGAIDYILKKNITGLAARISRALDIWTDLKAVKTMEEEISGSVCLNTELSIERYPLIAEGESRLSLQRNRRNSEIFGREGLDTETPVSLHHFLYSVHLLW